MSRIRKPRPENGTLSGGYFEIWFNDLKDEAQGALLRFMELQWPDEGGLYDRPLVVLSRRCVVDVKDEQGTLPLSGQPKLIVLCGPSHSGKSTFARRFCKGFRVVSSDRIRKVSGATFRRPDQERMVWQAFESEKRKALREGRSVVLDACHMSEKARRHALQGPNHGHRKVCVVFDVPLTTVRRRCLRDRRVRLKEVERMWNAFQQVKPTRKRLIREGFDEVYFVKG